MLNLTLRLETLHTLTISIFYILMSKIYLYIYIYIYIYKPGENNIIAYLTFDGHSQCSWDPWGTLCGLAVQCSPCGGVQRQSLKTPNYLKVFKALKQLILDCSIPSKYPKLAKEKFCYLKNKLTYRNKSSKIIFLYSSFLKNHEISFFLLQK